MAEPGGILISRQVYDQVHNKLTIGFEYLGERPAKNMPDEVSVYRITTAGANAARIEKVRPKVKPERAPQPEKLAHVWDGARTTDAQQEMQPARDESPLEKPHGLLSGAFSSLKTPSQRLFVFGVGAAVLLNVISAGKFWPAWPILAFALVYGQIHGEQLLGFKTYKSIPVRIWILSAFLICINLMTTAFPWAIFPVAALMLGSRAMAGRAEPEPNPEEQA